VGLKALLDRVGRDERGASLIEYALLVGLVTVSVLALMIDFASWAHGHQLPLRWPSLAAHARIVAAG